MSPDNQHGRGQRRTANKSSVTLREAPHTKRPYATPKKTSSASSTNSCTASSHQAILPNSTRTMRKDGGTPKSTGRMNRSCDAST